MPKRHLGIAKLGLVVGLMLIGVHREGIAADPSGVMQPNAPGVRPMAVPGIEAGLAPPGTKSEQAAAEPAKGEEIDAGPAGDAAGVVGGRVATPAKPMSGADRRAAGVR